MHWVVRKTIRLWLWALQCLQDSNASLRARQVHCSCVAASWQACFNVPTLTRSVHRSSALGIVQHGSSVRCLQQLSAPHAYFTCCCNTPSSRTAFKPLTRAHLWVYSLPKNLKRSLQASVSAKMHRLEPVTAAHQIWSGCSCRQQDTQPARQG